MEWEEMPFLLFRIGFIESGITRHVFQRTGYRSILVYLYIVPNKRRNPLTIQGLTLGRNRQNVRPDYSPEIVPTNTPS